MKILVYGAGVTGSVFSARLHKAGHDVSLLARGERLAAVREHGVLLAEGAKPSSSVSAHPALPRLISAMTSRYMPVCCPGSSQFGITGIGDRSWVKAPTPASSSAYGSCEPTVDSCELTTRAGYRYDNEDPYRHDQTKYPDDERSDRKTAAWLVVGPGPSN